jgi:hypothetical protein
MRTCPPPASRLEPRRVKGHDIELIFFVRLFGAAIGAAAGAAGGGSARSSSPGEAALILLIRKVSADKVLPQIQAPGTVIQTSLSNKDEQRLQRRSTPHAPDAALTTWVADYGAVAADLELITGKGCQVRSRTALSTRWGQVTPAGQVVPQQPR